MLLFQIVYFRSFLRREVIFRLYFFSPQKGPTLSLFLFLCGPVRVNPPLAAVVAPPIIDFHVPLVDAVPTASARPVVDQQRSRVSVLSGPEHLVDPDSFLNRSSVRTRYSFRSPSIPCLTVILFFMSSSTYRIPPAGIHVPIAEVVLLYHSGQVRPDQRRCKRGGTAFRNKLPVSPFHCHSLLMLVTPGFAFERV